MNPIIRYGSRVRLHGFATKQEAEEWTKPFKLMPDRLVRIWYSDPYQKWMAGVYIKESNPLTPGEKRRIKDWANLQFSISRKYGDQPVKSSFYLGRSVGAGKIARTYNPRRFDPIFEELNENNEEDIMVGINPRHILTKEERRRGFENAVRVVQERYGLSFNEAVQWLLRKSARKAGYAGDWVTYRQARLGVNPSWLKAYAKKHGGTYNKRMTPEGLIVHTATVDVNPLTKKECDYLMGMANKDMKASHKASLEGYPKLAATMANQAIGIRRAVYIMGPKSYITKLPSLENPILPALGEAVVAGIGLGVGFKGVDLATKRLSRKNPEKKIYCKIHKKYETHDEYRSKKHPCIFCGDKDTKLFLECWMCPKCRRSAARGFGDNPTKPHTEGGGKMRKTFYTKLGVVRFFGGAQFSKIGEKTRKSEAKELAKKLRSTGYNARVIKEGSKYTIWRSRR